MRSDSRGSTWSNWSAANGAASRVARGPEAEPPDRERQRLRLLDARLTELDTLDRGLEGEEGRRLQSLQQPQRELGELQARHREQGGA